jgi:hypothetical protein
MPRVTVLVDVPGRRITLSPRTQWRYASIHSQPAGGGEGSGRSTMGMVCRCLPRRQITTISSAPFRPTRSTRTDVPKMSVVNGTARCSSSIVRNPTRCSDSPEASVMASSTSSSRRALPSAFRAVRLRVRGVIFGVTRGMWIIDEGLRDGLTTEGVGPAFAPAASQ